MSPKQQRFVAEYLKDQNATQAAIRAGYSENGAKVQGHRLLTNPNVALAVKERLEIIAKRAELTRQDILEGWRRVIHSDVRKLFDADGQPLPINRLGDNEAALLGGFEITQANLDPTDGKRDTAKVLKYKLWDRVRYLEQAAKHFGMLDETINVNVNLDVRVRQAAERALTIGERR